MLVFLCGGSPSLYQRDYVPYENAKPPEPIRPKGNEIAPSEPIEKEPAKPKDTAITKTELVGKEVKTKEQDIDPLKHIHLGKAHTCTLTHCISNNHEQPI